MLLRRFVAFFRAARPAPAGTSTMHYPKFLAFNAVGGLRGRSQSGRTRHRRHRGAGGRDRAHRLARAESRREHRSNPTAAKPEPGP